MSCQTVRISESTEAVLKVHTMLMNKGNIKVEQILDNGQVVTCYIYAEGNHLSFGSELDGKNSVWISQYELCVFDNVTDDSGKSIVVSDGEDRYVYLTFPTFKLKNIVMEVLLRTRREMVIHSVPVCYGDQAFDIKFTAPADFVLA